MKFLCKLPNYRVILRPGIPGDKYIGRPAVSGLSVRFEENVAIVDNQETIDLLMSAPGFGTDFFAEDTNVPIHKVSAEPSHTITDESGKIITPPKVDDDKKKAVDLAMAMVQNMMPDLIKQVRESIKNETERTTLKIDSPTQSVGMADINPSAHFNLAPFEWNGKEYKSESAMKAAQRMSTMHANKKK